MVKLSPEQTIILIRLIKKYDFLWNPKNALYNNKDHHQATYEKIGSYFHASASEIRVKFRRLKCSYRVELHKLNSTGKEHSNLFYFDEMEYLRNIVATSSSASQVAQLSTDYETKTKSSTINKEIGESIKEYMADEMTEADINSLKEPKYLLVDEDEPDDKTIEESHEVFSNPEEQEIDLTEKGFAAFNEIDIENNESCENYSNTSNNSNLIRTKDEFDCFGTYIASHLRQFDTISALETMTELHQLISYKRIQHLEQQNHHLSFNTKSRTESKRSSVKTSLIYHDKICNNGDVDI